MSELQLRIKLEELLDEHEGCQEFTRDGGFIGSEQGCSLWLELKELPGFESDE